MLCSVMLWEPLWCILVNFGAFWCIPCATPWPLNDFLWLLYPSKCPFTPEMDDFSHSGQIWNTLLCHAMDTILVLFGAFWCTSCATPWPLHDLLWLLHLSKCPFTPDMDHISHSGQIRNTFALTSYGNHFGPFWSILVHLMGDPMTPLHQIFMKSSKTCILRIKSFKMRPVLPS